MTETRTARLGLPQWSAGTDGPSRADFNEGYSQLETLAAIDKFGTFAARPAAGVRGTYYHATDTGVFYRDTGAAWIAIGTALSDATAQASGAAVVPFTIKGAASQSADLLRLTDSAATVLAKVESTGAFRAPTASISPTLVSPGGTLGVTATAAGTIGAVVRGAASQSADLMQWQNSAGTALAKITSAGALASIGATISGDMAVSGFSSAAYRQLTVQSAPATPGAGLYWYLKSDGRIWTKNTSGVEVEQANVSEAQTLTNKTMSGANNTFSAIPKASITGAPAGAFVGTTDSQSLTNKTMDGNANTFSNLNASKLDGRLVTINTTAPSSPSVGDIWINPNGS